MKFFLHLVIAFGISLPGSASQIRLIDQLAQASEGSFLVFEQNKTFTFFHVHHKNENILTLEEVSIPTAALKKTPIIWKKWFEQGAPGHTCWIMSEVDLRTGMFIKTFSFTHRSWINLNDSNLFFTTLLNLKFQELPLKERRKIGLAPAYHKEDVRPVWNPRLIFNGQIIPHVPFKAYSARWPADGSELARKHVEIYLPDVSTTQNDILYPLYFPYWMELDGTVGSAKIRVVDSGLDACSPKEVLPKRKPQLMGSALLEDKGLCFRLKLPLDYSQFFVLAENCDTFLGNVIPLPCTIEQENKDAMKLSISKEVLHQLLEKNIYYRFAISPQEDPSVILEVPPLSISAL